MKKQHARMGDMFMFRGRLATVVRTIFRMPSGRKQRRPYVECAYGKKNGTFTYEIVLESTVLKRRITK